MPLASVTIDRHVVDSLMPDLVGRDRRPAAFPVYLYLATRGDTPRRPVPASYADLARATGLSKSAVQAAIRHLKRRRLVRVEHDGPTATPRYTVAAPWRK